MSSSSPHETVPEAESSEGGQRQRRRGRSSRRDYEIVCHRCGARDTVPFKPKPGRELLCSDCMRQRGSADEGAQSGSDAAVGAAPAAVAPVVAPPVAEPASPPAPVPVPVSGPVPAPAPEVAVQESDERPSFRVTCSHCGAVDTVPFKPRRGGAVLCSRCLQDPHVVRIGGRVLHSIVCAGCGRRDQVPFKPDPGSRVLCGVCHREEREARTEARERFWSRHPAEVDGSRVRIDARCDECGTEDGLSYVPRGHERVLCRGCVEKRFGESWVRRRRVEPAVARPRTCAACGTTRFDAAGHGVHSAGMMCARCEVEHGLAPVSSGALDPSPFLFKVASAPVAPADEAPAAGPPTP